MKRLLCFGFLVLMQVLLVNSCTYVGDYALQEGYYQVVASCYSYAGNYFRLSLEITDIEYSSTEYQVWIVDQENYDLLRGGSSFSCGYNGCGNTISGQNFNTYLRIPKTDTYRAVIYCVNAFGLAANCDWRVNINLNEGSGATSGAVTGAITSGVVTSYSPTGATSSGTTVVTTTQGVTTQGVTTQRVTTLGVTSSSVTSGTTSAGNSGGVTTGAISGTTSGTTRGVTTGAISGTTIGATTQGVTSSSITSGTRAGTSGGVISGTTSGTTRGVTGAISGTTSGTSRGVTSGTSSGGNSAGTSGANNSQDSINDEVTVSIRADDPQALGLLIAVLGVLLIPVCCYVKKRRRQKKIEQNIEMNALEDGNVPEKALLEFKRHRDPVFGIVFVCGLIAVIGLGINGWIKTKKHVEEKINEYNGYIEEAKAFGINADNYIPDFEQHIAPLAYCVGWIFVAAIFEAHIWMMILRAYSSLLLKISMILTIIFCVISLVLNLLVLNIPGAAIIFVYLVFKIVVYCWNRRKLEFVAKVLRASTRAIEEQPQILIFVGIMLIAQLAIFAVAFGAAIHQKEGIATYFVLLMMWWSVEVLRNFSHVTVCQVIGQWYLYYPTKAFPNWPVCLAVKNTFRYCFGSIAFGSLLVSMLKVSKYWFEKSKKSEKPIIKAIAYVFICCLSSILRMLNSYAFVWVAIKNKSYFQAAKETLKLAKEHGMTGVVGNSALEDLMNTITFLGSFTCCVLAGVWGWGSYNLPWYLLFIVMAIGYFIGYAVLLIPMTLIDSSVACIIMLFIVDPEALKATKPDLYESLQKTAEKMKKKKDKKKAKKRKKLAKEQGNNDEQEPEGNQDIQLKLQVAEQEVKVEIGEQDVKPDDNQQSSNAPSDATDSLVTNPNENDVTVSGNTDV